MTAPTAPPGVLYLLDRRQPVAAQLGRFLAGFRARTGKPCAAIHCNPADVERIEGKGAATREHRPRLLDLFCGAGGCSVGYQRAGFDVTGVDINPQPRYPFEFHQADALEFVREHGHGFDSIHASPPCQAFTQMSARWRGHGGLADQHVDLLTATRALLLTTTTPWVIENVQGAKHHMAETTRLHGGMFGLGVHRPRLFESNVLLLAPRCSATPSPLGVYGTKPDGQTTYRYRNNGNYKGKSLIRTAKSIEEASAAMGIDWMTWDEIREAIPPAYTEFIGAQLLRALGHQAPRLVPDRRVLRHELMLVAGL